MLAKFVLDQLNPIPDWFSCIGDVLFGPQAASLGLGDLSNYINCLLGNETGASPASVPDPAAGGTVETAGIIKGIKHIFDVVKEFHELIEMLEQAYKIFQCLIAELPGGGGGAGASDSALASAAAGAGARVGGGLSAATAQLGTFIQRAQTLVDATTYIFGSSDWINPSSGDNLANWLTAFGADATPEMGVSQSVTADQIQQLEAMPLPEGVSAAEVDAFLQRWNATVAQYTAATADQPASVAAQDAGFIDLGVWNSDLLAANTANQQNQAQGFTEFSDAVIDAANQLYGNLNQQGPEGGICARVKLETDQTAVVTRNAFDARLELDNSDMMPLTQIGLTLLIRDASGNDATSLFVINPPTLSGLTDVNGQGTLAENSVGTASFILIPTNDAAPDGPTQYFVSAILNYDDEGATLSVPFTAQSITVLPNPSLTIRYFQQRDVIGDDPFTPRIEPSQPFALGVQVENVGAGTAGNFSITSAQPKIIDNQKGLLVNFQIIGTQVDGQNVSPSLTANFGDISPGGVATAVFLMESSIQGQFIDYSASFENLDGLGNPQVSIINSVEVHELIHLAEGIGAGDHGKTAFLVNDIPDANHTPDTIFLPDGSWQNVDQASGGSVDATPRPGALQVQLSDAPSSGWSYLDIDDPGGSSYRLVKVTRSDGIVLPASDVWQTDRTFIGGGRRPVYEHKLHLLDDNSTGSYTLTYAPISTTPPAIVSLSQVVPSPSPAPVDGLTVTFSEPIDLSTFDYRDLDLARNNGPNLVTPGVTVSLVAAATYKINGLAGLDAADGAYSLTVQAAQVSDLSGNPGSGSATTSWVEAATAPALAAIGGVAAGARNTPVSTVDLTFTAPIAPGSLNLSALRLTRDGGGNLLTGAPGLTLIQVAPATVEVGGLAPLTATDGQYVLTVDPGQVTDSSGIGATGGPTVRSWLMDTAPPSSLVSPLAVRQSALAFPVSVTGTDPAAASGAPGSGIASFDLYVSQDGGPFVFWTTVPASSPTAVLSADGSHTYAFRSVATDAAGNVEVKPPVVEASTYVPDLVPPETDVTAVDASAPAVVVSWTGTDAGGSGLASFALEVQVDSGPVVTAGVYPASPPDMSGISTGSAVYQAITDGVAHTYRFFTVGIDGAGNVETPPASAGVVVSAGFAAPAQLGVTGFVVEHGVVGRSFIRYLDVQFNQGADALQTLLDTGGLRFTLIQHQLDGVSRASDPATPLAATNLRVLDHAIEIDFGSGGIGGDPESTAADGYYELDLLLADGSEQTLHFDRLLGDVNGDGSVDAADFMAITAALGQSGPTLDADVDGDTVVNANDRLLAFRARGHQLAGGLHLDG
jgi:hypothetical protein